MDHGKGRSPAWLRRAWLPENLSALVEGMTADETTLQMVNINQIQARTLIVQGGAYGEHQIQSVMLDETTTTVDARTFAVTVAPGSGARLTLKMARYANRPSFALPWVQAPGRAFRGH